MSVGEGRAKRKYLPAEAYRFLVLAALAHAGGAPRSKGVLAWETRANHYMITRVLRELSASGHLRVETTPSGACHVALTEAGRALHESSRDFVRATFGERLAEHFRYGRAPAWASWARGGSV